MRLPANLGAAVLLFAAPALAATPDAASAQRFVEQLYGAYHGDGPDYLGRQASRVFSPRILALLRRDAALTPKGDVGALDGDPICDCQDFGIRQLHVTVEADGPGRAKAVARFVNLGTPVTVRFDLVAGAGGWRIDNLHSPSTPDLADYLKRHAGGR